MEIPLVPESAKERQWWNPVVSSSVLTISCFWSLLMMTFSLKAMNLDLWIARATTIQGSMRIIILKHLS